MKKILSLICLMMLAMTSAWAGEVATFNLGAKPGTSTPSGFFTYDTSGKWNFNNKFTGGEYDGISFSSGLKMEGTTKILFTTTAVSTVTIVQSDWSANTIKLDGEELAVADAEACTGGRVYTVADVAAGDHNITRGSGESGLFLVKVEYADAPKTVTFINDANWAKVNVWAWNDTENFTGGEWPGVELTEKDADGNYTWTTTGEPTKIIFNDGGSNQTPDLEFKDGGVYNSKERVITLQNYTATFKTDGMDEVWAYAWNGEEKALGEWPGTKMEGSNGEFSIAIKAEEAPAYIIFHNNAGEQTPDLAFEDGKAYEYMLNEYAVTFTTDAGWETVNAYAWSGDGDNAKKFAGEWPGTALTATNGVFAFAVKAFNAPEKIIFNNGDAQTADLPFINGKAYKWITATPFYALKEGDTFAAGTTVDLTDATITFGVEGGAEFGAASAAVNEDYAGFAFMTGGNGENGSADGGTVYTIVPKYDGTITIGVRLNGGKKMHINEDGTDLADYAGITIADAANTSFSFAVKACSTYKIWCDGSKLGFFGFDYKYEAAAETATFNFADPKFRENIGTAMTDVAGYIYNETFYAGGVSLQITAGSAPSRVYVDANRGQNLVTYTQYSTLTFRAPEGKAITKIEFTAAGNSNINNFVASSGAIEGMTWTGNADGVRFAQGGTSYLANAIVTLETAGEATEALPAIEYVECANIAAFNALEAGTYAKLTLTDAEIIGKSADGYSTVFVQDATGGAWIQYTSLNDQLQESTKVNGTIYTVKRVASGNTQLKEAEDTPKSKLTSEAIDAYTIVEGTIADVNTAANLNKVVKIYGATLEMTSATAGNLTQGETTIDVNNGAETANQQLHKIADWAKDEKLEDVTIVAILVAKSATANQLLPISIEKHTYTLAGAYKVGEEEQPLFFGETWEPARDANLMVNQGDGTYAISFKDVTFEQPGTILYKVCEDKGWAVSYGFSGENADYVVKKAGTAEEVTFTFNPAAQGYKVSCTVKFLDSDLMKEARELAADDDAVAVGKLRQAIEYAEAGDESGLQAAIDQFKADNADQEKDETAKVATNGWKKYDGTAAGVCATQFAPAITTNDGRENVQLAEVYEGNTEGVNRTGTIIYQDITGLTNGKYKVGFYGNAFYTSGRGFDSPMEDGADDVAYVFANKNKAFITARIATSTTENDFRQFDVDVTDGTIKLGMGKEKAGTNWHTMQIYQLTWFTTAKEVYAADKAELTTLVAEAKALLADENKTKNKEMFELVVNAAESVIGSNMYNITEVENVISNLKDAINDFKKANWYIDFAAGEYYVIDAESGLMMAAGNDYGTHGIVNETGLDLTLTPYAESRTVTIDSRVDNGNNNHFLGGNMYMDSSEWGFALEYQGFGFYILEPDGGQYINIDTNNNLVLSDTPREFIIVTKEGVMEERMEELAEATKDSPVDATFLLQNPNFNRNDQRVSAWTVSEDCTNKNLNGGNNVNNCAESFHSTFTIMQTVEGAPAGKYTMTAQGFYRQDAFEGEEAPAAPVFFANNVNRDVPALTGSENSMSAASESFTAGLYTIEPIEFTVVKEGGDAGKIYVGVTAAVNNQWVIFDNFRLTYYGDPTATAISEVSTANQQAANEGIFNLAGQRVVKAQKGLYIINGKKQVVK